MVRCQQSRRKSQQLRQKLTEFRDSAVADEAKDDAEAGEDVGDGDGGNGVESAAKSVAQRVAVLEADNHGFRELAKPQTWQLAELERGLSALPFV